MNSPLRCRCGHSVEAHEHFRSGKDCSACGPEGCRRFSGRLDDGVLAGLTRRPQPPAVVAGLAWNRFRVRH